MVWAVRLSSVCVSVSVCRLSVGDVVAPSQTVEFFGNISAPSNSLGTWSVCINFFEKNRRVLDDRDLPTHNVHNATFMGLRWWLRVVYSWAPPLLSVFGRKKLSPVLGQNLTVLGDRLIRNFILNLSLITPKRHILA